MLLALVVAPSDISTIQWPGSQEHVTACPVAANHPENHSSDSKYRKRGFSAVHRPISKVSFQTCSRMKQSARRLSRKIFKASGGSSSLSAADWERCNACVYLFAPSHHKLISSPDRVDSDFQVGNNVNCRRHLAAVRPHFSIRRRMYIIGVGHVGPERCHSPSATVITVHHSADSAGSARIGRSGKTTIVWIVFWTPPFSALVREYFGGCWNGRILYWIR